MKAADIRRRFLEYFVAKGHTLVPSSSLVPADDPTLLFVNAGMVQFKRTFLGQDPRPYVRATTCQKCVRAGGKHNDLEQVGQTTRHFTFFEMLGNFSFGDYFKRDAIAFAWEFITSPAGLNLHPDRLSVTVHKSDDEARKLWLELSSIPNDRIYGLGDKENFWQMGDTGPCGPCSEIFVDLEWKPGRGPVKTSQEDFEVLSDTGRFVEFWNLVFMQFDRSTDGVLTPLPKPSVDTGAGLDRLSSVLQGYDDIFHSDIMRALLDEVGRLVGRPYPGGPQGEGLSYRVLGDHARSVAFLLLDGVFPSNEGRGFVVRRILRRGVRHAWLLGRREPTLALLIPKVVDVMGEAYPDLVAKQQMIIDTVRGEEERFLSTIEAGLERLEGFFASGVKTIPGDEAFKLFDTFGFPIDLTELIAAERGVGVDIDGFEVAMKEQRERSRAVGKAAKGKSGGTSTGSSAGQISGRSSFIGYSATAAETSTLSDAEAAKSGVLVLQESPFYATSGGQTADTGLVKGAGWTFAVTDVVKDPDAGQRLIGALSGEFVPGSVQASVDVGRRRDIERNHSATHLAHMVLRRRLGDHVRQQGSLVEPGRLRFDFSHGGVIDANLFAEIEAEINELILANAEVDIRELPLDQALKLGAMAFFADKYGDVVRVVTIGDSIELCGGTHVKSAGQIGLFRFASQGGVAAGVRRIEAITGRGAYQSVTQQDRRIGGIANTLKAAPDQLERKLESLIGERDKLDQRLKEALKGGGSAQSEKTFDLNGATLVVTETVAEDRGQLGEIADAFRGARKQGAVLMLHNPVVATALSVAVTDDLIKQGKDANALMKFVTGKFGGRGGGRPTFASGSLGGEVATLLADGLPAAVQEWLTA